MDKLNIEMNLKDWHSQTVFFRVKHHQDKNKQQMTESEARGQIATYDMMTGINSKREDRLTEKEIKFMLSQLNVIYKKESKSEK